jgi:streptogramin lyase
MSAAMKAVRDAFRGLGRRRVVVLGVVAGVVAVAYLAGASASSAGGGIFFRSASVTGGGVGSSLVVSSPSGALVGDVLVAAVDVVGDPVVTGPSGWSVVRRDVATSGSRLEQLLFVHVVGSAEPSSYRWSFSVAHGASGGIVAYGGVDRQQPVDTSSGGATASAMRLTAPSLTTSVVGGMVVAAFGVGGARVITPASNLTERFHGGLSAVSGEKVTVAAADRTVPAAGQIGASSAGLDKSGSGIGQVVVLRPAPASADATPPTTPSGLTQNGSSGTSMTVSWTASSDNVAVAGYTVYLDSRPVATTASTSYVLSGVGCGTNHTIAVDAFDAKGNHSAQVAIHGSTAGCPTGTVVEFPVVPTARPSSIALGPDGNIWFTLPGSLARVTPTGSVRFFPTPTTGTLGGLTAGQDGNVWFSETTANKIARSTPTGSISEFPVSTPNAGLAGIANGADGNLWFVESYSNKVGRITPQGSVVEYTVPTPSSYPHGINRGPDNNIWFVEVDGNKVGRIAPSGAISEYAIPTPDARPLVINRGPDGNLWFTEQKANKIGRITPRGSITEFPLPTPSAAPSGITSGPDGNIWFTEKAANKIGRITPTGAIREWALPTPAAAPNKITSGPDGNIWFTEQGASSIGRITP